MTKRKSITSPYTIKVWGESESDWSGAVPESIDSLIEKPSKDTASLLYQVVKAQVEMLVQAGKTAEALEAIQKYREQEFQYTAPLNCFRKDRQNGQAPYIGAHCFVGAFRDAAKFIHGIFYQKKGDKKPSKQHLRKFIQIRPHHIFLHRPDGKMIPQVDGTEGQQPTPDVQGFAKYEVIFHPFTFRFGLRIIPKGPFAEFLADRDKVLETLHQAAVHGAGARRAAGYGMWRIVKTEIEDHIST